jgi:hypothetical protein
LNTFSTIFLFLFVSSISATCLDGGVDSPTGIGLPLGQPANYYCIPGQSFTALDSQITDVEMMISSTSTWTIQILNGAFQGTVLATSSQVTSAPNGQFTTITFNPPVPTTIGSVYTILPQGTGTLTITSNGGNPYTKGCVGGTSTSPPGGCYSNVGSAFKVNCNPPAPPPAPTKHCINGGLSSNIGIGQPIQDTSGYCGPVGQSFTALDNYLYDMGLMISQPCNYYVQILNGEFQGPILANSSQVTSNTYDQWTNITFNPPVPTTVGNVYTIVPIGSGTWFITCNNGNPYSGGYLSGTNPPNACWEDVGSAFQVNCS